MTTENQMTITLNKRLTATLVCAALAGGFWWVMNHKVTIVNANDCEVLVELGEPYDGEVGWWDCDAIERYQRVVGYEGDTAVGTHKFVDFKVLAFVKKGY